MVNKKRQGTVGERELIHQFWANDIPAVRVAGSGSMRYPSPDIVAGTPIRKLAIECKTIKDTKLYIPKSEIEELKEYASKFGAEPWLAVRFDVWYFVMLDDLRKTTASFSINTEEVRYKGLLFEDILKGFQN